MMRNARPMINAGICFRFVCALALTALVAPRPLSAQQDDSQPPPSKETTPQREAPRDPYTPKVIPRQDPDLDPYDTYRPDRGLPPQLRRDYPSPDPNLPWSYRGADGQAPNPYHSRYTPPFYGYGGYGDGGYGYSRYNRPYRTYDYGYGDYYRYRGSYGDPYFAEYAYEQGVADGRRFEEFEREAELGLASYLQGMEAGQTAFAQKNYAGAARGFVMAARINQGDAASRVCAANALIALKRYDEAADLLRRAFQLQPNLAFLPLDLPGDYANRDEFDRQVRILKQAAQSDAENPDVWALLGYVYLFSGQHADAGEAIRRARDLAPRDRWITQLAKAALLPSAKTRAQNTKP